MFTIVTGPPLQSPDAAFMKALLKRVELNVESARLDGKQALDLCEYLDCIAAKVPGLSKRLSAAAGKRLHDHIQNEISMTQAQALAKRSPAARAFFKLSVGAPKKEVALQWG